MSECDHKMTISLVLKVQFTQFFFNMCGTRRDIFKTTSSNLHLTWRPPVINELNFFRKQVQKMPWQVR